jgi:hypothetical protein
MQKPRRFGTSFCLTYCIVYLASYIRSGCLSLQGPCHRQLPLPTGFGNPDRLGPSLVVDLSIRDVSFHLDFGEGYLSPRNQLIAAMGPSFSACSGCCLELRKGCTQVGRYAPHDERYLSMCATWLYALRHRSVWFRDPTCLPLTYASSKKSDLGTV